MICHTCKHLNYICASTHYLRWMEITAMFVCLYLFFDQSIPIYFYTLAICTHSLCIYLHAPRCQLSFTYATPGRVPPLQLLLHFQQINGHPWPKPLPLHQLQRLQNMYQSEEKNTDTDQVSECKPNFWLNLLPLYGGTL